MKKYIIVLFVLFLNLSFGICQKNPFENEILAFEKSDSIQMPPENSNLFVGSSTIRLWNAINYDFPNHNVMARGFGGSNLVDLELYVDRIITKYSPAKIFIYSGENDIAAGASAIETAERFKAVFEKIRLKLPQVPIVFISIKPSTSRWDQYEVQKEANMLIRSYLKTKPNTQYVSVVNKMLLKGKPNPSIFLADKLHMNKKGYEIWTKKLKRYLVK